MSKLLSWSVVFCIAGSVVYAEGAKDPSYPPPSAPAFADPYDMPSGIKLPAVVPWPAGKTADVAQGLELSLFADNIDTPRWMYVLENGDVLVAQSRTVITEAFPDEFKPFLEQIQKSGNMGVSPNQITLLRDSDKDGDVDDSFVLLEGLRQPFGMVQLGDYLYVANTDGVKRYPFSTGQTRIDDQGVLIVGLPADGMNNHWTRNVVASPDGRKLYVSVGSATNVDEERIDVNDPRRAAILEMNPDGTGLRVYASGLRNPVGMAFQPETDVLFTTVNERDMLGDDLVPDYLTSIRAGGFYGWPYSYFGQHVEERKAGERDDLVAKAIVPDMGLGAHTASLGLLFSEQLNVPDAYKDGVFIAQHGSSNRTLFSGYKVVFVPFKEGRPSGEMIDVLAGFIADEGAGHVYGRPVGVAAHVDGSLLVSDDSGNRIWRISKAVD